MDRRKKTLLVGLDAACWTYVEPLLHAGRMPVLQRLMDAGVWGTMRSTMPPWTPTAWASIITGKNPGKHGVFDMLWRRQGTYEFALTNAKARTGTPFWQRLNECGVRVGLVNVPYTHPPDPLDGFVVCGFGTPQSASDLTYPSQELAWIERELGEYEPTVPADFLRRAAPLEILDREKAHQAQQVRIAANLAKRYEVDVLVVNLMLTDHANHKMPHLEQVQMAYGQADRDLGQLIDAFGPDNVLLVSDHGSSRLKGDFLLNDWLRDHGYLVPLKRDSAGRLATLNWLLAQWLQNHRGWSGLTEKVLRRMIRESLFNLPGRVQSWSWKRLEAIFPRARERVFFNGQPDYSRTQLFAGSAYAGLLYFNVAGREAMGVVPREAREALASAIATKLRQIEEPETGRPVFSNVYTATELYTGSAAAHAPDLILDSYDSGWNIRTRNYTTMPGPMRHKYFVEAGNGRDFGWHSRDGIFVFSGQDFSVGPISWAAQLMDVAATLLHLYNVPVPEDYDGRVLRELLLAELCERPVRYQSGDALESGASYDAYSAEEAEEVLSHLRALGYLD